MKGKSSKQSIHRYYFPVKKKTNQKNSHNFLYRIILQEITQLTTVIMKLHEKWRLHFLYFTLALVWPVQKYKLLQSCSPVIPRWFLPQAISTACFCPTDDLSGGNLTEATNKNDMKFAEVHLSQERATKVCAAWCVCTCYDLTKLCLDWGCSGSTETSQIWLPNEFPF